VLQFDGVAALLLLFLWIYCVIDVISTDSVVIRNLPKTVWLMIVLFIPDIGSIAWLLLGRPERAGFWPGGATSPRAENPHPWMTRSSPHHEQVSDTVAERDRLMAQWTAEDTERRQAMRDLVDREAAVKRREAELRLIEARIAEREAQRQAARAKANGGPAPTPEGDDLPA
jgi:hypothetical protein